MLRTFGTLIVMAIIISSGISCENWDGFNTSAPKADQQSEKTGKKSDQSQNDHWRPKKDFGGKIPADIGKDEKIYFEVIVTDLDGLPVNDAKVTLTFRGEDQFGEPLPYEQRNGKDLRPIKRTNASGVAKFKLLPMCCYNFKADVVVEKKGYHDKRKMGVTIHKGSKPRIMHLSPND